MWQLLVFFSLLCTLTCHSAGQHNVQSSSPTMLRCFVTLSHTHTRAHAHTHTHTHARAHTHTHTHTHAHVPDGVYVLVFHSPLPYIPVYTYSTGCYCALLFTIGLIQELLQVELVSAWSWQKLLSFHPENTLP